MRNIITIKYIPVPQSILKEYFSLFYPCKYISDAHRQSFVYQEEYQALYTRKVLHNTSLYDHKIIFMSNSKARVYVKNDNEKMVYDRASKYGECVICRKGKGCIVIFDRFKSADEFVENGEGEFAFKNANNERWGTLSDREDEKYCDE